MTLYFVTSNQGKFLEVKGGLKKLGIGIKRLNINYPEIQADTIEKVTLFGLEWLSKTIKKQFFIDDSGLFIDYLKGYPGVYSSFVFRTVGCAGILKLMEGVKNRDAEFQCCIGYCESRNKIKIFKGISEGQIATESKGTSGFGFDPIFIPNGYKKTFAELSIEEKNEISHRSRAILKFANYFRK